MIDWAAEDAEAAALDEKLRAIKAEGTRELLAMMSAHRARIASKGKAKPRRRAVVLDADSKMMVSILLETVRAYEAGDCAEGYRGVLLAKEFGQLLNNRRGLIKPAE